MKLITNKSNIAITLIMALLLTACGDEPGDKKTVSISNEGEGKVFEIQLPGADGATVKALMDKKGSIALPEWVPENFPIPEGSQILSAINTGKSGILMININETVEPLANYFYTELEKDGWESSSILEKKRQVTYKKDKILVVINVDTERKDKNKSRVTIGFSFE